MSSMSTTEGMKSDHLVNAFSWDAIGPKLFANIGDSGGKAGVVLAQHINRIQRIVKDLPRPFAEGSAKLPVALVNQVKFMAHDASTEQPFKEQTYTFTSSDFATDPTNTASRSYDA